MSKEWSFLKPNPELLIWDRRVNTSLNTTTDLVNISIYNGWLKAGQKKMTGVCPHHKWSLLLALFPHFEYIDPQRSTSITNILIGFYILSFYGLPYRCFIRWHIVSNAQWYWKGPWSHESARWSEPVLLRQLLLRCFFPHGFRIIFFGMFDCGSSTEIGKKCGPTHPLPILMANLIWVCLGLFWKRAHPKFDQTWWLILIFLIKAASLGWSPCFWTNYFVGH